MTKLKLLVAIFVLLILSSQSVLADDRELFNRALGLSKQGQWQQAADVFAQIASRNPQWPEPKNNLAVCLLNLGKVTEAQQSLDAAVVSRSSFSVAHTNRLRLYDYFAAQAYSKALSQKSAVALPVLDLISALDLPTAAPVVTQTNSPVVNTASNKPVSTATVIGVESFVNNWAQAWSKADIKNYLAAYSENFKSDDGKQFEQWADMRRLRLKSVSGTKVDVDDLHVYVDASQQQAVVEFVQSYTSSTYHDRTVKQLLLTIEGNNWRILAERVIAKL